MRLERRERWRIADITTHYWKARRQFESAVGTMQSWGLPEGRLHPAEKEGRSYDVVRSWREALVAQLLTPAPDISADNWKKAAFAQQQHHHIGVRDERIERAIAEDIAFLAAHPTRRSINATKKPEPA